jgi:hypothetical protein
MKEPNYKSALYAIIFLWLGLGFVIFAVLSFAGVMTPTEHSLVQDQTLLGGIFSILGITFVLVQVAFRRFSHHQVKLHNDLMISGSKISGNIESIRYQKWIQFAKKSPYVVYYTYTHKNNKTRHKSNLLWEKPNVSVGDQIDIYVNDDGQSTAEL